MASMARRGTGLARAARGPLGQGGRANERRAALRYSEMGDVWWAPAELRWTPAEVWWTPAEVWWTPSY